MSRAKPMDYNRRCRAYFTQRGIDPGKGFFYAHLTPRQMHRAFKKERQSWKRLSARAVTPGQVTSGDA